MRIKVITKRYIQIQTDQELISTMIGDSILGTIYHTQNIPTEEVDFIFKYEDNIVSIQGSSWSKPANSLEEAFNAIKQYFHGTNYAIVDFLQMN